jgi:hypothetical protein
MNIIQVLRQYNPKSMERRGINLAAALRRPGPSASGSFRLHPRADPDIPMRGERAP